MMDAQQISKHRETAEAGVAALSVRLGEPALAGLLPELETVQKSVYAAGVGLSVAPYNAVDIAPDLPLRLAEAEDTLFLIERHIATNTSSGEIGETLQGWHKKRSTGITRLPPIPEHIDIKDPYRYAELLCDYVGGLAEDQLRLLRSGNLSLSPEVNDALLATDTHHAPTAEEEPVGEYDVPLLQLLGEVFDDSGLGSFIETLITENRINLSATSRSGFAFSVAPEFAGLPLIHVPIDGTWHDLVQLAHHVGHSYHRMIAQEHGTVLAPIGPDIDEIIPLCFELKCEAWLAEYAPDPARILRAARMAEVAETLATYQLAHKVLQDARAGTLTADMIAAFRSDDDLEPPGYAPPHLASYTFGAIVAAHLWQGGGWNFAQLDSVARLADRAAPENIFPN